MEQFFIIANQLVSFLIMMIIGFIAAKLSITSEAFLDNLSQLIMKIILPILIFTNAVDGTTRNQLFQSYPIILLGIGMYFGLILIFIIFSRVMRVKESSSKVYRATMIFGNVGFIGIPILTAIFPKTGALYIALLSIVDQCLLWTYGEYLTSKEKEKKSFNIKNFINPALISVLSSLVFILIGIKVPSVILTPLQTVGKAATPLSLIYLGGLFYYCNWKIVLKEKELYGGIIIKMILFPVAFYYIAKNFCSNIDMVQAVALISGLPTMTTIAMFAKSKDNNAEYAVGTVLVTTAVCLLTLTVVSYIIF